MAQTFKDITRRWSSLSMLMKIIIVNIAIFLLLRVLAIFAALSGHEEAFSPVISMLELPGSMLQFLTRPWTALTYMFTQFDLSHILFNMLWLYWFGTIFMELQPWRRLLPLYIYGGLFGAVIYMLFTALTYSADAPLIGSSAAVIAIVAASAIIAPDYLIRLIFIGNVKLKWIAIITIAIDLLGLNGTNAGGHIAHVGGALMGVFFALMMRKGIDITNPFNRYKTLTIKQQPPRATAAEPSADTIDAILDKIKRSGYTSLTPAERAILFSASSKSKKQ